MGNADMSFTTWADMAAASALLAYMLLAWMRLRGRFEIPTTWLMYIRWVTIFALLLPVGARFYFSVNMLLYLGCSVTLLGLWIKIRRMWGI